MNRLRLKFAEAKLQKQLQFCLLKVHIPGTGSHICMSLHLSQQAIRQQARMFLSCAHEYMAACIARQ